MTEGWLWGECNWLVWSEWRGCACLSSPRHFFLPQSSPVSRLRIDKSRESLHNFLFSHKVLSYCGSFSSCRTGSIHVWPKCQTQALLRHLQPSKGLVLGLTVCRPNQGLGLHCIYCNLVATIDYEAILYKEKKKRTWEAASTFLGGRGF